MVRKSVAPYALCALLALLLPVAGCAFKKDIGTKDSTAFGVNFALKEVEDCSNVSPEVQLENVPKDAKRVHLKFLNIEFGATLFDNEFGFETTKNGLILKGSKATLPKGSIPDYKNPCAKNKPQTYSIQADVKDDQGRALGTATTTKATTGARTNTSPQTNSGTGGAPASGQGPDAQAPPKPAVP